MGRYSHVLGLGSLIGFDIASDATPDDFWSRLQIFLKARLGDLLYALHCFFTFLAHVFNSLLPPETRSFTLLNILAGTVKILLVILVVYLLFKCLFCCCGRSDEPDDDELTMRAPGRPGIFMPRDAFESDPRSYFLDLRANRPLLA